MKSSDCSQAHAEHMGERALPLAYVSIAVLGPLKAYLQLVGEGGLAKRIGMNAQREVAWISREAPVA